MTRPYKLKRRADKQEETHGRIVRAAVELHQTTGPAQTTISAIAELAGVQRLTVYKHFPDERALFSACTAHYQVEHPAPDPTAWKQITDPEARLRTALTEVYQYFARTEPMMAHSMRDLPLKPVLYEILAPLFEHWRLMHEILASGWGVRGKRFTLTRAAVGHALDFGTWRSLVRQQGLTEDQAVDFMVRAVLCVAFEK